MTTANCRSFTIIDCNRKNNGKDTMPTHQIQIASVDGVIDATLHVPAGTGPWPGVVMLTDIMGPRPVFFDQADRLAGEGYAVLLPNPYYREGPAPVPDLASPPSQAKMQTLFALMGTLTPGRLRSDGKAIVDGLAARPEVKTGPVAVVGYCMGGRFAVYFAEAAGEKVGAIASYHGAGLVSDDPDSPHKVAANLSARMYFGHADGDEYLPFDRLPEFEKTLADAGATCTSEVYAGARHGFAVPGGPAYNEDAAQRHWHTLLGHLASSFP